MTPFGLELRGIGRAQYLAKAQEVLDTVGLGEWGRHYPDQLSGGMQQRVGLARALATDPEIVLMDEPFSAMDPLIRRRMQDELIDLQERLHKTILFLTHDLDEALRLGSHIAIMKAGQIVQIGTPEDILLHPADEYVAAFTQHVDRSKVLRAQDVMFLPTRCCGRPIARMWRCMRWSAMDSPAGSWWAPTGVWRAWSRQTPPLSPRNGAIRILPVSSPGTSPRPRLTILCAA